MKSASRIILGSIAASMLLGAAYACTSAQAKEQKTPVDYVNPYIGNISHLLVPTFPTIQLPNSMLRVYPERADYTTQVLNGMPVVVTHHRERSAFNISAMRDGLLAPVRRYEYDNERLTPYSYAADITTVGDTVPMGVRYALSHQSAIYDFQLGDSADRHPAAVTVNTRNGRMTIDGNTAHGYQKLSDNTNIYLYVESEQQPVEGGVLRDGVIAVGDSVAEGRNAAVVWRYADGTPDVRLRYGISFISEDQAKANLNREIDSYDVDALAAAGKQVWNDALGRIKVDGASDDDKTVLYSSYYRTFERPICYSEDGRYHSPFDGQVHDDEGTPFFNDDWIWDTYRAAHPLRALIDQSNEEAILASYLRMAQQMGNGWMPTFPESTGDSRRMNSNHGVAMVADAMSKGLKVDGEALFEACRKGIEEKTLAPWCGNPGGEIDAFFWKNGYIPALRPGEKETDPNVNSFEARQPVAVTLGTSYDLFCLARIAEMNGHPDVAAHYDSLALNYRNLYNPATAFFHPKDKDGKFIEPFDYRWDGGPGARHFYGENNGWVYRWDVPHNVADLIDLMGGKENFVANLDQTFREPLGKGKSAFYATMPDHTGNVGQFSMANEPSLHIPYLYNYAGAPWKTQKTIRDMLKMWFRNDVMGIPGDEDGGGMTSFVVFSKLGFYPVTPGMPVYNIGSPIFEHAEVTLSNGKVFEIDAKNVSDENKYIQSATLNGKPLDQPWFTHDDIKDGGKLELVMGPRPNRSWGTATPPPSLKK